MSVSGPKVGKVCRAIACAKRLELPTNSMWEWELQFYKSTNRLAAIRFQGEVFLADGGEWEDSTGTLSKLYLEALKREPPLGGGPN